MRSIRYGLALAAALTCAPSLARAGVLSPDREVLGKGVTMVVEGQFQQAEPILRRAIAMNPNLAEGHYNLAVSLRAQGRFDEAVGEYRAANNLFQSLGGPNGEGDVASCLYGIALTEESKGDPRVAAGAWNDYLRFATRYEAEQPAVEIARNHVDGEMRAANLKGPFPLGSQKASRPVNKE